MSWWRARPFFPLLRAALNEAACRLLSDVGGMRLKCISVLETREEDIALAVGHSWFLSDSMRKGRFPTRHLAYVNAQFRREFLAAALGKSREPA